MRWHIVWYVVNAFFLSYSNNMNHLLNSIHIITIFAG